MTESIRIRNYQDTLYFSSIEHDIFCEYRLPGHGLMWVRSGHMTIESKAQGTITAHAGDIIFWQRDCSATMSKHAEGDTPYQSIALTLPRPMLKYYFRDEVGQRRIGTQLRPIAGTATLLPKTDTLVDLFSRLQPYFDEEATPAGEVINAAVNSAIAALLEIDERFYPTLFDFHETWKIDLYDFMHNHFMEDMRIEDFAAYSGRSLATFKRDFAKISPETPQRWLIARRLDYAKQLLSVKGACPSEVYMAAGFKNRAHFFTSFKQRFGQTPIEYQQFNQAI